MLDISEMSKFHFPDSPLRLKTRRQEVIMNLMGLSDPPIENIGWSAQLCIVHKNFIVSMSKWPNARAQKHGIFLIGGVTLNGQCTCTQTRHIFNRRGHTCSLHNDHYSEHEGVNVVGDKDYGEYPVFINPSPVKIERRNSVSSWSEEPQHKTHSHPTISPKGDIQTANVRYKIMKVIFQKSALILQTCPLDLTYENHFAAELSARPPQQQDLLQHHGIDVLYYVCACHG